MRIEFLVLLPIVFWLFIVMLIIAVAKPKRRPAQGLRNDSATQRYLNNTSGTSYRQNTKPTFSRPKMSEGLFDMKLGDLSPKKEKQTIFSNTGYDDYSAIGRKKDYVNGYDKKYANGSIWARQSAAKQYSHTYDGHEPWDKCVPKEKDPWDKDFYT